MNPPSTPSQEGNRRIAAAVFAPLLGGVGGGLVQGKPRWIDPSRCTDFPGRRSQVGNRNFARKPGSLSAQSSNGCRLARADATTICSPSSTTTQHSTRCHEVVLRET